MWLAQDAWQCSIGCYYVGIYSPYTCLFLEVSSTTVCITYIAFLTVTILDQYHRFRQQHQLQTYQKNQLSQSSLNFLRILKYLWHTCYERQFLVHGSRILTLWTIYQKLSQMAYRLKKNIQLVKLPTYHCMENNLILTDTSWVLLP